MKKNTKGFTLIELLAVIVILAIIALIATPIVLNLIEKARKGAAQDSAYGVRKSAQLFYQTMLIDNINGVTNDIVITFEEDGYTATMGSTNFTQAQLNQAGFELDGTLPTAGKLVVTTTGEVYSAGAGETLVRGNSIVINGYGCSVEDAGKITCEKEWANS